MGSWRRTLSMVRRLTIARPPVVGIGAGNAAYDIDGGPQFI
jgi:hypothetical protein